MPDDHKVLAEVSFEDLRLYHGSVLQMQFSEGEVHYAVKFIGAIKEKSILMTLPVVNGKVIGVHVGQICIIRGFTGMYAFAFEATVIKTCNEPSPYVHFAYPHSVNSKAVRKSIRVKVNLPATVTPRIGGDPVPVTMVDLSTTGTMVDSISPIGEISDVVKLALAVSFDGISANMDISAILRSMPPAPEKSFRACLEFDQTSYNDNLILRCIVHAIESGTVKFDSEIH